MGRRSAVVLVGVLLLAGAACGDPSSGNSDELNALQAAAEAVEDATSSRMDMTMEMGFGGVEVTAEMDGVFDYEEQLGEVTMTFDSPVAVPGAGGSNKMIVDGTYAYVKGPAAELYGGTGDGWIRMDMSDMPGMSSSQVNQDPTQYIEFLRGATGDIEKVGTDDVRGVSTTHYRAELTLDDIIEATQDANTEAYAEQLEKMGGEVEDMPVDVWIGADGLPRRMELSMRITDVPGVPDGEMTMEVGVELYDFGVPVDVKPPKRFEEVAAPLG